jgi:KTSC domain
MIPVNSSSIRAVGFDGYHLFVQFHTSTTIYTHYGVPHQIHAGLMRAGSKGGYYNNFIRGKYK